MIIVQFRVNVHIHNMEDSGDILEDKGLVLFGGQLTGPDKFLIIVYISIPEIIVGGDNSENVVYGGSSIHVQYMKGFEIKNQQFELYAWLHYLQDVSFSILKVSSSAVW